MQNNLLLGNGINIYFGINELFLKNIAIRFKNVLVNSSPLYECLFNVSFTSQICDSIFSNAQNLGIETLSAEVYKYVYLNMDNKTSLNNEYRLHNSIKASAINAIFYNNEKTISLPTFDISSIDILKQYQSIYTLNYAEFWDTENLCNHLHGSYSPKNIKKNFKPIILYTSEQYHLDNYRKVVNNLKNKFNMIVLDSYNIIFSPLIDKQKVLGVGHYPSENLYMADDLFPFDPPELYTDLKSIPSLDVFGMSPFGDDKLITCLSNIKDLTIYVFQMNNIEVSEWNKKLKRNCCKDSSLFWRTKKA